MARERQNEPEDRGEIVGYLLRRVLLAAAPVLWRRFKGKRRG